MGTSRAVRQVSWFSFLGYLVGVLLAISFILFTVLDTDGSDFPVSPDVAGQWVSPSEAEAVHDLWRLLPGRTLLVFLTAAPGLRPPADEILE